MKIEALCPLRNLEPCDERCALFIKDRRFGCLCSIRGLGLNNYAEFIVDYYDCPDHIPEYAYVTPVPEGEKLVRCATWLD